MSRFRLSLLVVLAMSGSLFASTARADTSLLSSEQQTCTQHSQKTGIRDFPDRCYGGFADAASKTNGIDCVAGAQACCSNTTQQPTCYNLSANFSSAPADATSTVPAGASSGGIVLPTPNTTIVFDPEIPIPNFAGGPVSSTTAVQYIRAVFIYFIWIVGVLAVVMVTYGGVKWVAAAGNPGRINDARSVVNNALIGLIIALTSVVLLNIINPSLTKLHGLTPVAVTTEVVTLDSTTGENNEAASCKTKKGTPVQQETTCFVSNQSFVWPVSDANHAVNSRMGPRSVQVGSSCHPGTDFSTNKETGKNVVAMFDGTINSITPFCNENIIKLVSSKGFYARYVHIHTVTVKVGQNVKQGDSLGKSGGDPSVAGSCSTGAHLHVEVYDAQSTLHDVYPCVYQQ